MTAACCSICGLLLDQPDAPLSEDCGGDCLGCMIALEDGDPAPPLPLDQLRAWITARSVEQDRMWLGDQVAGTFPGDLSKPDLVAWIMREFGRKS